MQDPARLLFGARVDIDALKARERLQGPEREVGVDEHRHPRRDQRVPTEERHEPRCARGHHRPIREFGIEDAQAGDVTRRAVEERPELIVVGADHGQAPSPLLEPGDRRRPLHRLSAQVARRDLLVADDRRHLHARRPAAARRDDDLVVHVRSRDAGLTGEVDVRGPAERAALVREGDAPLPRLLQAELALLVDPTLLDLEQVGEVGSDEQLDRTERGLLAEVLDFEILPHPRPM